MFCVEIYVLMSYINLQPINTKFRLALFILSVFKKINKGERYEDIGENLKEYSESYATASFR